ncbi:MAG: T9SS type A sorting domain-containing protein [Bacteroidota bacterium]
MSITPLHAQEVIWEFIGPAPLPVDAIVLKNGTTPDGSADTLYATGSGSVELRRITSDDTWSESLKGRALTPDLLGLTAEGYLLTHANAIIDRSTDGGQTWELEVYRENRVSCFLQTTLPVFAGAVLACRRIAALLRSDDAGATWTIAPITPISGEGTGSLWEFAEVPVSEALPAGRLLAATNLGVLYSDDGAVTWQTSDLWRRGETYFLARHDDPAHAFGGPIYASAPAVTVEAPPSLWASEDGGATWEQRTVFDMASYGFREPYTRSPVVAGADGSVWMSLNQVGPNPNVGVMVRSSDGGHTWQTVGDTPEGDPGEGDGWGGFAANDLLIDRRGVLWAATDRGVYRTTTSVVVVTAEEEPPGKPAEAFELGAPYPNPTREAVTVPLMLAEAAAVHVAVYDLLGRQVALLHDGVLVAGSNALAFETTGLPAGVYVVRASVGDVTETRRVTVAR